MLIEFGILCVVLKNDIVVVLNFIVEFELIVFRFIWFNMFVLLSFFCISFIVNFVV